MNKTWKEGKKERINWTNESDFLIASSIDLISCKTMCEIMSNNQREIY
jgi:hypothetical protein